MNCSNSGGSVIGRRRKDAEGYTPLKGASAGLDAVPTYAVWKEDSVVFCHKCSCNRLKTSLMALLRLRPFHQPSTTPLLSPYTVKSHLCVSVSRRYQTRHSKATASAQPMSRCPLSVFHPGMSHQALHFAPMVMAIPNLELASEKAWASKRETGPGIVL